MANHRSISAQQELILLPAYDKARPAVPVAAIYGANASGKSNLLGALAWMRAAVTDSFGRWQPNGGVPRDPFLLDPAVAGESSRYSVDFVADGVRHTYGFAVDNDCVREEWLYVYGQSNRKRVIFEREGTRWQVGSTVPKARFDVLRELTRDNGLFLSAAAQSGTPETAPAFRWFERMSFSWPAGKLRIGDVIAFLESSEEDRAAVVALTRAADLGITDVRPAAVGLTGDAGLPLAKPDLEFVHASGTVLSRSRQSRGTLEWLGLLVPALLALRHGSQLCVDEIDASLHPRLTPRLIELFRGAGTNRSGAQLLFTTHDVSLLGSSFGADILGRDEVWFVEKDASGATSVFPLTDFHPRKEENTERRYLGGAYGAVPDVSEYQFRVAARPTGTAA